MKKKNLLDLISVGKTQEVISRLQDVANKLPTDLEEEVILLAARFATYTKEKRQGLLNDGDQQTELIKINAALIGLVRQLPENIPQSSPPRKRWRTFGIGLR